MQVSRCARANGPLDRGVGLPSPIGGGPRGDHGTPGGAEGPMASMYSQARRTRAREGELEAGDRRSASEAESEPGAWEAGRREAWNADSAVGQETWRARLLDVLGSEARRGRTRCRIPRVGR